MRGETMKDKSKKSTYSTTFGVDPKKRVGLQMQTDPESGGEDEIRTHDKR